MMDLSLAGLIGAFIGTAIAAVLYAPLVSSLERFLRAGAACESAGKGGTVSEQETSRLEISLLRRGVLAADIIAFAGFGYWLAATLVG
jgi:hypothetical protein